MPDKSTQMQLQLLRMLRMSSRACSRLHEQRHKTSDLKDFMQQVFFSVRELQIDRYAAPVACRNLTMLEGVFICRTKTARCGPANNGVKTLASVTNI